MDNIGSTGNAPAIIQYVPEAQQSLQTTQQIAGNLVGISGITNGAFNFFSQFSNNLNSFWQPFFVNQTNQITSVQQTLAQAQQTAANKISGGK